MGIQISDLTLKAWVPYIVSDFYLFFIDPLIRKPYTHVILQKFYTLLLRP